MRFRSTWLALLNNCPAAMRLDMEGAPRDRRMFGAGTVAHAILQHVISEQTPPEHYGALAAKVVHAHCVEGRTWDGVPQGVLTPERGLAGEAIALAYLGAKPIDFMGEWRSEVGLAMDAKGHPVAYDSPAARYVAAIDVLLDAEVEDEEDGSVWRLRETKDWKSAWPTNQDNVNSLQQKGQTVLAWLHAPEPVAVLRRTLVNLRTTRHYSAEIWPQSEGGKAQLEESRSYILRLCNMAEAMDGKPDPGFGCLDCPFSLQCPVGREWVIKYVRQDDPSSEVLAKAYAYVKGVERELAAILRTLTKEESLVVDDTEIGYAIHPTRAVAKGAVKALFEQWVGESPSDSVMGFLGAANIGVAGVSRIAKKLTTGKENKDAREALLDEVLTSKPSSRFGVRQVVEGEE